MGEEGIDLRTYGRLVLKWWWLLVLGVVVGLVPAALVSRGDTPIYEATTRVFVEGRQTPGLPSSGDITASQSLAATYSELIKTRPILQRVVEDLKLPYGTNTLAGKLKVSAPRSFINITASDPDPAQAAVIANKTGEVFIQDFQDRQLNQIARFQQIGGPVQANTAELAAVFSSLSVVEDAVPPPSPVGSSSTRNIVLGGVIGLLAAALLVLLLEYLDDRIKSPEDLKGRSGLPVLATVPVDREDADRRPVITSDETHHVSLREAFRFLETNLEFVALEADGLKSVLVTSPGPLDGKTTTASNLAVSLAKNGKSVILLDCDLRKPALQETFQVAAQPGLTRLVMGTAALEEALATTPVEGLKVIPSGPIPPEPTQLLGSERMKTLLQRLEAAADVVVIDTAPVLAVADPLLLVPLVDVVLLVVDARSSRRDAVVRSVESLRQAKPRVMGAVLNQVVTSRRDYYSGYYHYYHPSADGAQADGHRRRNGVLGRILGGVGRR